MSDHATRMKLGLAKVRVTLVTPGKLTQSVVGREISNDLTADALGELIVECIKGNDMFGCQIIMEFE